MIRVPKPVARAPVEWLPISQRERDAAIAAFKGKKPNDKVVFKFEAYGHVLLRKVLNEIFAFKCAYCESFYGATQPVAIEHYRPKGEVVEGRKRLRGYYWLAATWDNLYPSCTDCNSRRTHTTDEVRGKGNFFPLADPKKRARGPRSRLDREGPLLLDPCTTDPQEDPALHLEFLADGTSAGVVRAALRNGVESAKGKTSIDIYALDRPQLVKARRDYARRVLFQCRNTERALQRHQAAPNDAALRDEYRENLDELRSFLQPDQPYVGMVRQLIARRYPGLQL